MNSPATQLLCSYTEASSQAYIFDERDPYQAATAEYFDLSTHLCPYCAFLLTDLGDDISAPDSAVELRTCRQCGWWVAGYSFVSSNGNRVLKNQFRGEAKHYNVSDLDAPLEDLRRFLAQHPEYLGEVHHRKFELLIADCLKVAFGAADVAHTGGTADGGIDLLMAVTADETYLVQVKRRKDLSSREGVQVVRELNGVLFRENVSRGLIVTTASDYTEAAKLEAHVKTPTQRAYVMKLLRLDDVVQMLRLPRPIPYEPWTPYLRELDRKASTKYGGSRNAEVEPRAYEY